ncbi:hypothetical protein [Paraburkholderia sediminicola]|uniref:hypothetical protein n=1 Tax=Paraburkholderia sediminicola TaxID=458836 RepID=UPI0038B809C5
MSDLAAVLYPSATGGSGATLSPLSAPVAPAAIAAPAAEAVTVAPEVAEHVEVVEPIEQPETVAEPVLDSRPKIDGWFADARETEPAASSITDYATFANADRPPTGIEIHDRAEFDLSLKAMQQAGLGQTTARAVFQTAMEAIRNPISTTSDAARSALQAQWGDKTDANLSIAKQQIDAIAKTWPGVRQMLDKTGLGNSPEFIKQLVNRAKR